MMPPSIVSLSAVLFVAACATMTAPVVEAGVAGRKPCSVAKPTAEAPCLRARFTGGRYTATFRGCNPIGVDENGNMYKTKKACGSLKALAPTGATTIDVRLSHNAVSVSHIRMGERTEAKMLGTDGTLWRIPAPADVASDHRLVLDVLWDERAGRDFVITIAP